MRVDLVAYDRNGQIALIVEVKKKLGTSSEWAAMLRRNMVAHGALPDAKFFLFALPDRFYIWKNVASRPELVRPTFEIDPQPLLQPYFDKVGVTLEKMSGRSFELIIAAWLGDLLHLEATPEGEDKQKGWIVESGLFEAIHRGHLDHEVDL